MVLLDGWKIEKNKLNTAIEENKEVPEYIFEHGDYTW